MCQLTAPIHLILTSNPMAGAITSTILQMRMRDRERLKKFYMSHK